MKLVDYFLAFLRDVVNLNQTRLDQLDSRVKAIYGALQNDGTLGPLIVGYIPQGSWAHRTIIKPLHGREFDADFLLELKEQPGWRPADYLKAVFDALGRNGTYVSMRLSKTRCVRIVYENDCHIDIVPFVRLADGRKVIVNNDDNAWEETNPEGFTVWMVAKDEVTGGTLRQVIRLLKYLRDYKETFAIKSVLLTALVGEVVTEGRKLGDPSCYADVSTTLRTVINDLDAWLQARPTLPTIVDPSCPQTNFNHRWNQAGYSNFRDKIHMYAGKVEAAYTESDREKSLKLWQAIFGDDFKKPATSSGGGRFTPILPPGPSGRGG